MTRLALLFALVVATGCSTKPSTDDCRKAIANMQRLMGTDNMRDDGRIEGEVRRCKGGSKKQAVDCAMKAQSLDDLRQCEFFKVPDSMLGTDPGTGSAARSDLLSGQSVTRDHRARYSGGILQLFGRG